MARSYQKKGKRGGRPPVDDSRLARALLFECRVMGGDREALLRSATERLILDRSIAAEKALASGKRKTVPGRDSARRRVIEAEAAETRRQGDTPLTGLPDIYRHFGEALAKICSRDGYAAGRTFLVELIAIGLNFGSLHTITPDQIAAAEAWLASIEAQVIAK